MTDRTNGWQGFYQTELGAGTGFWGYEFSASVPDDGGYDAVVKIDCYSHSWSTPSLMS